MARMAINGLGRIGKLVLRALVEEGIDGDIVLLNDPAGDPAQHAMLLEFDSVHGRWRTDFGHEADALIVAGRRMRFTQARGIEDLPLAEARRRPRDRLHRRLQDRRQGGALLRRRCEEGARLGAGEGRRRAQPRLRRQPRPLRSGRAPARHGGELHDQLPRAGGEGAARGDRHLPRLDHHDPRRHQHADDGGPAREGPAPRPLGAPQPDPDDDRIGDGDHADLSGAEGPAERPRRARAAAQRLADRLRLRDAAGDHGGGGERLLPRAGRTGRSRASSASRSARWSRPTS